MRGSCSPRHGRPTSATRNVVGASARVGHLSDTGPLLGVPGARPQMLDLKEALTPSSRCVIYRLMDTRGPTCPWKKVIIEFSLNSI